MKEGKKARRSREEWRALVQEWRASGLSMKEFAGQRGVSASSLAYWSSTLKREPRRTPAPRLLPVRVSSTVAVTSPGLELVLGPLRLRFDGGTSPTYIAEVARALLSAGSA